MKKPYLLLFLIILFTFVCYSQSLSFFFISDDFYHISFHGLSEIFSISSSYNHYIPIFLTNLFLIKQVFGTNPFYFHLYTLCIHLINILLAYILSNEFFKKRRIAILTSFCFSIFFTHYESVYWITGTTTSLMTLLYLSGLISFVKYIKTNKKLWLILSSFFSCISFLSHEYAITIIPMIIVFGIYYKIKRKNFAFLIFPIVLFSLLSLFKIETVHAEIVKIPTFLRFIQSVIRSNEYALLPFPGVIEKNTKVTLFFLTFCMLSIWMLIKKDKRLIVPFLWLEIQIVLFSATSLPQARYFYLASIPALWLTVHLILKLNKYIQFIVLIILIVGFINFLSARSAEWRESSRITYNTIAEIKKIIPQFPQDKKVYFINLPDSVNGPPWNAYLFRNGMERVIQYVYGRLPNNIYYLSTEKNNILLRSDPYMKKENLSKINGITLVYELGNLSLYRGSEK